MQIQNGTPPGQILEDNSFREAEGPDQVAPVKTAPGLAVLDDPAVMKQVTAPGVLGRPGQQVLHDLAPDLRGVVRFELRKHIVPEGPAATVESPVVGEADYIRAVPLHSLKAKCHQLRMQEVVCIEENEELSADVFQSDVASIRLSAVGFVNDLESVVALSIFLCDSSAVVCAAVIYEDGFPVLVCLAEDAVESATQVLLCIIYWYDD